MSMEDNPGVEPGGQERDHCASRVHRELQGGGGGSWSGAVREGGRERLESVSEISLGFGAALVKECYVHLHRQRIGEELRFLH